MDLGEALRRRRMVRRHTGDPVPDAVLAEIVDATLAAPTAGNSQGVALVVVTSPEEIDAIARIAGEPDYVARGFDPWISTAGAILVLCAEPEAYRERYRAADKDPHALEPVPWWWVDVGAAFMAILLTAVSHGLGAGFLGAQSLAGLSDHLGIPDEVEIAGIITVGPPAPDRRSSSLDRSDRTRIHHGRWSRPA